MATKSGKLFLKNEAQPADYWSHYTPYSQLEPFRIDPTVKFDPGYRDLVCGGVLQLRHRRPLSGAGTHDGVGNLLQVGCGQLQGRGTDPAVNLLG
jgi:hypothetical protein